MHRFPLALILMLGISLTSAQTPEVGSAELAEQTPSSPAVNPSYQTPDLTLLVEQLAAIASNTSPDDSALKSQTDRENRALQLQREDLTTQQNMATWTFWVALASFGGLIVSAVGIFLLKQTLDATRAAAAAAEGSTFAALKAVEVSELMGRLGTRAYMVYTRGFFYRRVGVQEGMAMKFAWENDGSSPANNVAVGVAAVVAAKNAANRASMLNQLKKASRDNLRSQGVTNVGKKCLISGDIIVQDRIFDSLFKGEIDLYISTCVIYTDIFNVTRINYKTGQALIRPAHRDDGSFKEHVISIVPLGPFNAERALTTARWKRARGV